MYFGTPDIKDGSAQVFVVTHAACATKLPVNTAASSWCDIPGVCTFYPRQEWIKYLVKPLNILVLLSGISESKNP